METTEQLKALEAEFAQFASQRYDNAHTKPRIAAWGLVKAGKSSLLNMLSGHASDEHFQTGDVRTTLTNQELELNDYILVDTPGQGYSQEDTQKANQGLDGADIVLFVHAPPGELDQEEIGLLDQLRNAYGQNVGERVVLVISQLDKLHDDDIVAVKKTIEHQALIHLGTVPECFVISNTRFKNGVKKGKQGLCEKSGIPQLALHLQKLSKILAHSLTETRKKRLARRTTELCARIDVAIEKELKLIEQISEPYATKAKTFVKHIADARRTFKRQTSELNKARITLENPK